MSKKIYFLLFLVVFFLSGVLGGFFYPASRIVFISTFLVFITALIILKLRRDKFISSSNIDQENFQEKINLDGEKVDNLNSKIETSENYLDKLAFLEQFQLNLSKIMDEDNICRGFVDNLKDVYQDVDYVLLYLINFKEQSLELKSSSRKKGAEHIKEKVGDTIDRVTLHHNTPVLIEDIRKDFRFSLKQENIRFSSCMTSPISLGRRTFGIIRLESKEADLFNTEELRFLQVLSEMFAVFLESLDLYKRTEELAIKDSLTGFYLRNYTFNRFEEEVIRAKKYKRNIAVVLVDIDDFKKCNDTYGHLVGDVVLEHIAESISEIIGNSGNVICRYGGEEFLVILPNMTGEQATAAVGRLRETIEKTSIKVRRKEIYVTISAGVSIFPKDGEDAESLIKKADSRLYLAKKTGKNKVCH